MRKRNENTNTADTPSFSFSLPTPITILQLVDSSLSFSRLVWRNQHIHYCMVDLTMNQSPPISILQISHPYTHFQRAYFHSFSLNIDVFDTNIVFIIVPFDLITLFVHQVSTYRFLVIMFQCHSFRLILPFFSLSFEMKYPYLLK